MNQMQTVVFDPEVFKQPNPTRMPVRCECGKLSGEAEVIGIPKKSGATKYLLSYEVSGAFYQLKDDLLTCVTCRKPALSRAEPEPRPLAGKEKLCER